MDSFGESGQEGVIVFVLLAPLNYLMPEIKIPWTYRLSNAVCTIIDTISYGYVVYSVYGTTIDTPVGTTRQFNVLEWDNNLQASKLTADYDTQTTQRCYLQIYQQQ